MDYFHDGRKFIYSLLVKLSGMNWICDMYFVAKLLIMDNFSR